MQPTDHKPYVLKQPGDYTWAVLHIAWYRDGKDRHLVFGFVELVPAELSKPEGTTEVSFKVNQLGKQSYLYFKRLVITVDDALKWYEECRQGNVVLLNNPKPAQLTLNTFKEEPTWPTLVTTAEMPFVPFSARAHHLLQLTLLPQVQLVRDDAKAMGWLSEHVFFDFLKYPEQVGSLHLVAQNPVYRSFRHTLGKMPDGREASDIHFIARKGQSLGNLSLHMDECRPMGKVDCRTYPVTSPYMQIPHVGRTDRIGISVLSDTYGVLDFYEPACFLGQLNFNMSIGGTTKIIEIPGADGETYEVPVYAEGTSMVVGETSTEKSAADHLHIAKTKRETLARAEKLGQMWFYDNPTEARDFIRAQIGLARRRLMIIDPYFASVELYNYALATRFADVKVDIVTSSEVLKKYDKVQNLREAGDVLLQQLEAHKELAKFNVTVMTGNNVSPIHDRFLVIDDTVWFVGNSLHTIGQRAGMMIKLPNPLPVLQDLESIIQGDHAQPLADWVAWRNKQRKPQSLLCKCLFRIASILTKRCKS